MDLDAINVKFQRIPGYSMRSSIRLTYVKYISILYIYVKHKHKAVCTILTNKNLSWNLDLPVYQCTVEKIFM